MFLEDVLVILLFARPLIMTTVVRMRGHTGDNRSCGATVHTKPKNFRVRRGYLSVWIWRTGGINIRVHTHHDDLKSFRRNIFMNSRCIETDHMKHKNAPTIVLLCVLSLLYGILRWLKKEYNNNSIQCCTLHVIHQEFKTGGAQDFICNKRLCQSWGLREKVVCQSLRGPHWPKYKIVNSNTILTNQMRAMGKQTFNSTKAVSVEIPQMGIYCKLSKPNLVF